MCNADLVLPLKRTDVDIRRLREEAQNLGASPRVAAATNSTSALRLETPTRHVLLGLNLDGADSYVRVRQLCRERTWSLKMGSALELMPAAERTLAGRSRHSSATLA